MHEKEDQMASRSQPCGEQPVIHHDATAALAPGDAEPIPCTWHEGHMSIYRAALQGFISNKDFHGGHFQGSPIAAHEFAMRMVGVALNGIDVGTRGAA